MRQYTVTYTEHAEFDLRGIYECIALTLLVPITAGNQLNRIINAIAGLNRMPERYRRYEKEPWRSMGLRVMPVGNYLVFYVPEELPSEPKGLVSVIRIIYKGRDINEELKQTNLTDIEEL